MEAISNFNAQPDHETPLDSGEDNELQRDSSGIRRNSTTTYGRHRQVTNVNEPPQFPNGDSGTRSVTENTAAGQNVGAPVSASDPEKDSLTYSP